MLTFGKKGESICNDETWEVYFGDNRQCGLVIGT